MKKEKTQKEDSQDAKLKKSLNSPGEDFGKKLSLVRDLYREGRINFEEIAKLTELPVKKLRTILEPEKVSKVVLVTGGAGFIGSNFIHHLLSKYPNYKVINFDKLTYAGNVDNLRSVENDPRYSFAKGDIADVAVVDSVFKGNKINYVVNFAAETHVERSIYGARQFILTNVLGVQTLLDAVNKFKVEKMVQISTDESYGTLALDDGLVFSEDSPLKPNVPYSASKAGGELICRAYYETHKTPVVITHCTNNYGPYQYPEKVIPLFTLRALKKQTLPIHGRGQHVRDWLFVKDHCRAIDLALHKGQPGQSYNIAADNELPTIEIASRILKSLGRSKSLLKFIPDRPGNDLRYALATSKIKNELDWTPEFSFDNYLDNTISWYLNNPQWIDNVRKRGDSFTRNLEV